MGEDQRGRHAKGKKGGVGGPGGWLLMLIRKGVGV